MSNIDDVIADFLGTYQTDDTCFRVSNVNKEGYFPTKGVRLTLTRSSDGMGIKIKVTVPTGGSYTPQAGVEAATYLPSDDRIAAMNIKVDDRTTILSETLSWIDRGNKRWMMHTVLFSDGVEGYWICPRFA